MIEFPEIFRVRQSFPLIQVEDVANEVEQELSKLNLGEKIQPGQTVAITAGSRGIANIAVIIRGIAQHLLAIGAKPYIVPAMGSHGGGVAENQRKIIEGYGISEEYCGCPIKASMETIIVCQAEEGFPVHFDKHASEADHVVVCGRVKPHTNFVGDIESGLMKMMLIGLGKHAGAKIYHRAIKDHSFGKIVRSVAREVLSRCGVVAGLGIVENGYDETAKIKAVAANEFEDREKELLVLAKEWMPRLPFDKVDTLLIDEIGKNISGSGLDTNVVGRKYVDHAPAEHEYPKVKQIIVRGLTEETHGNASGLGLAEFCRTRVVDTMDMNQTRINCLTGGHATGAMIPLYYDTDRELLEVALPQLGLIEPPDARLMWIRNTLDVAEVECSKAYFDEAQSRDDLEILGDPRPLPFDEAGNLTSVA